MKRLSSLAPLLFTLCVIGCGQGGVTHATGNNTYPAISGNWEMDGSALNGLTALGTTYTGSLQSNGGSVSGTLNWFPVSNVRNECIDALLQLNLTGTIDSNGNLALTAPLAGGIAKISTTLTTNLQTLSPVSFEVDGGDCPTSPLGAVLYQYKSLTGTYTGALTATGQSTPTTISVSFIQSAAANTSGIFSLSGVASLSGPGCSGNFTFSGGTISGSVLEFSSTLPNTTSNVAGLLNGFLPTDDAATIQANVYAEGISGCPRLNGILTRQ